MVVICLKNRTFAVSQTTYQRIGCRDSGCDLLEKSYFCSIANNTSFARRKTYKLWFAWKIVLLQYRKQHSHTEKTAPTSCDLLEKSYFCSIANNLKKGLEVKNYVVICLKNRTFAVSQTTSIDKVFEPDGCDLLEKSYFCSIANNGRYYRPLREKLWFAWKIVLLQYRKQPTSKLSINSSVVICLKNRTFAVSQTTLVSNIFANGRLWFAWKIVLLQYRKQHVFQH